MGGLNKSFVVIDTIGKKIRYILRFCILWLHLDHLVVKSTMVATVYNIKLHGTRGGEGKGSRNRCLKRLNLSNCKIV